MTRFRRFLSEPLVHFLLLGGLLFLYFEWRQGGGPSSRRIVVTRGQVDHLASGFARTWQRAPTAEELKGLVDEYIKEEIAAREAQAMGLDRDDTIIRRRLRQKLEFVAEAAADQPPADAELQDWLAKHPQRYQGEPCVALRQVFFSSQRRGVAARRDAERALEGLRRSGAEVARDALGDTSMLPRQLPLGPRSEVVQAFGDAFAAEVDALPVGAWSGPVASPYGLHLVWVEERVASPPPLLADVRPFVERDVLSERRRTHLQALYERLLQQYTVTTEAPKKTGALAVGAGGGR